MGRRISNSDILCPQPPFLRKPRNCAFYYHLDKSIHRPFLTLQTTVTMPPKKKVERAATENISLGPQVREGEFDGERGAQQENQTDPQYR